MLKFYKECRKNQKDKKKVSVGTFGSIVPDKWEKLEHL
jgi:hypothetical protein